MQREWHFVYGTNDRQGWQFNHATGWVQVSLDELDEWSQGSFRSVEWPHVIPSPTKDGPPRERW